MPQRVIVTRPAHDAQAWVSQLQSSGFLAHAMPLIDIAAVTGEDDVAALKLACLSLQSYTACMFVSANAVKHFFSLNSELKVPLADVLTARDASNNVASDRADLSRSSTLTKLPRFLAPGPGTAAALRAAGVPAEQMDAPAPDAAQFDSEALWQVVGQRDWRGATVLIVRGKGDAADSSTGSGRDWLMQQWHAAGATVKVVSSYERRAAQLSAEQLALATTASGDGSVWLFSSSEALGNLGSQPGLHNVTWQRAHAVATHPRIQAAAVAAGWGVVHLSRPALPDIVQALAAVLRERGAR